MTSRKEARKAVLGVGLAGAAHLQQLAHANSGASPEKEAVAIQPPQLMPELRSRVVSGAVGAVSNMLDRYQHDLRAAQDLIASGATVIELDPADVDDSILRDRLDVDPQEQAIFVESIRQSGQQIPILVRQIRQSPARYQIAYGHRRVAACRQLGRKVLAIVRTLSDEELLLAQGQENSARTDLSFIERALFSLNLEKRGVSRETIMLALTTDKTELSKMISVARSIPEDIIRSIGPAPKAGRPRWLGLSERLSQITLDAEFRTFLTRDDFTSASTDVRFELIFKLLQAKPKRNAHAEQALDWATSDGRKLVRAIRSPKATILTIDEKQEPGFADFLFENLDAYYDAFRSRKNTAGPN